MAKSDMRIKAQLAEDLVTYLSDYENSIICNDLGLLIDGLIPWMTGSHFKVSMNKISFLLFVCLARNLTRTSTTNDIRGIHNC
jgi:hypothetical protein